MWGLWTPEEFDIFDEIFRADADRISEACGNFYVLADISEFPPQRPSVTDKLKASIKYAL